MIHVFRYEDAGPDVDAPGHAIFGSSKYRHRVTGARILRSYDCTTRVASSACGQYIGRMWYRCTERKKPCPKCYAEDAK